MTNNKDNIADFVSSAAKAADMPESAVRDNLAVLEERMKRNAYHLIVGCAENGGTVAHIIGKIETYPVFAFTPDGKLAVRFKPQSAYGKNGNMRVLGDDSFPFIVGNAITSVKGQPTDFVDIETPDGKVSFYFSEPAKRRELMVSFGYDGHLPERVTKPFVGQLKKS